MGKPTRPQYIPAEKCRLVWGQKLTRKVTEIPYLAQDKLDDLNLFTCRSPGNNLAWIKSVHQMRHLSLDSDENKVFQHFGVRVGESMVKVDGRTLAPPDINYSQETVTPKEGSWYSKPFLRGCGEKQWAWIYLGNNAQMPDRGHEGVQQLRESLRNLCGHFLPPIKLSPHLRTMSSQSIQSVGHFFREAHPSVEFVVFISQSKMPVETYNAVKFLGDVRYGVHTSCILENKFKRKGDWDKAYFDNVALKINLKLGGANHRLAKPENLFKEPGLMVAGYDVTHPTEDTKASDESTAQESGTTEDVIKGPGEEPSRPQVREPCSKDAKKEKSQVGLVISADVELGQWYSYYWNQPPGQEMTGETLTEAFKSRIEAWKPEYDKRASGKDSKTPVIHKKTVPLKVVIYRDGVSESQFDQVLTVEIPNIRKAYAEVFPDTKVQITLLVAIKRHTTRFFDIKGSDVSNIKPGTVVDNGVTQPKYWEFFLASHAAVKGTTKPTRYVVILDEIFRTDFRQFNPAGQLEQFTNQVSHLFGRATKAVSVCTPAYYADILCTRARAYKAALDHGSTKSVIEESLKNEEPDVSKRVLAGEIHDKLKDSMYWI